MVEPQLPVLASAVFPSSVIVIKPDEVKIDVVDREGEMVVNKNNKRKYV